MAIELTDDGTLDTVLRCSDCGEEMRYNFDPGDEDDDPTMAYTYNDFVTECIEDATTAHECGEGK